MGTLHCALENGADLHVNERQKTRHYRRKKKNAKLRYRVNSVIYAVILFMRIMRVHVVVRAHK